MHIQNIAVSLLHNNSLTARRPPNKNKEPRKMENKILTPAEEAQIAAELARPTTTEIVNLIEEDGFEDGWYIIETNKSDLHVICQSNVFPTKEKAESGLKDGTWNNA